MDYFKNWVKKLRIWGFENTIYRFYSRYPAEVLDNVFPDESDSRQKLLLHIPVIHEVHASQWVDAGFVISGQDYGFQSMPRKGDFVYVTFGFGDSNHPRWHYGWYGKDQKPEEFKSKDVHGFKSPGKAVVAIDDLNQRIYIKNAGGKVINIDMEVIEFWGNDDNMVRFSELKDGFDKLKEDFNSLVTTFNSHIHTTTATVGPSAVPGVIAPVNAQGQLSSASIDKSKIEEIKTFKQL